MFNFALKVDHYELFFSSNNTVQEERIAREIAFNFNSSEFISFLFYH